MFSESAEFYDALYSFKNYEAEAAQIAALVRSVRPDAKTILDVACGTGEHVRLLARLGFDVDGLDIDPGLLRLATQKHPAGQFFAADMSDFTLPRRYDVITCLFSSIGYLLTIEPVTRALNCFHRHLAPGGVVLVDPWFAPGKLDVGRVSRISGTAAGTQVTRTSWNEVDGRVSRLHFTYEIEGPDGKRHTNEVHELGLFTPAEMGAAFKNAGLDARFDTAGLSGRGLWVATAE